MKDKYKKFYMMFDKRFKNLILCSNLNCDSRISASSDFAKPTNVDKLEEQLRESLETFKQKKVN